MSDSNFDADTAVHRVNGGVWRADLQARWNVGNNPNGCYLLAVAVRAMVAEAGRPDPISVTGHFLSPPAEGASEIRTQVVKAGRSFTTVEAALVQDGRDRV
ncbi:MAG: acyl-CoA thioesterase domain-containing protein, partial [Acidimicrobiales bacterium]